MMRTLFFALVFVLVGSASAVTYEASDFGVKGNGITKDTSSLQKAIDAAAAGGGGVVRVRPGVYLTGSLELKGGVELHLEKGATLKGSVDRADYNANDAFPENVWSDAEEWSGGHLVWARSAERIAITGEGTIDGNGPAFFGECDEDSRWPWYKYGLKLHPTDRDWFRPGMMLAFFRCKGVRIEGVTLANSTAWTCHLRCCDGVTVRGVTIDDDRTIANSDGFSIDCTRNVTVEKCTLKTGDDGFAIRASCCLHAATNFCENIVIRDCDIWSCCYGIRFGIGTGTVRNVRVLDTRIHEASESAFGFTSAWVAGARNCYIEDVLVRNCTAAECVRPVSGGPSSGDSKVVGIRFEDCRFDTLLPSRLTGGPACEMAFTNCERRTIERFKVRHHAGWGEGEIRDKRSVFVEIAGDRERIRTVDCRPLPFGSQGVLLLSFDDRFFADWERAIPLFEKYGAHATFFIHGDFDSAAVRTAKRLMSAGHSIGLHGRGHANAPEAMAEMGAEGYWQSEFGSVKRQCDVAYVPVRSMAYANCRHDDASDKLLLGRFDRLRAGLGGVRPYDPKGEKHTSLKPLVTDERVFFPVAELPRRRVLETVLLGEAYNTDIDDVVACICRAGKRKEALVLTSHAIRPDAKDIHLKTEWLEAILKAARESDVAVLGYDEVPLHH